MLSSEGALPKALDALRPRYVVATLATTTNAVTIVAAAELLLQQEGVPHDREERPQELELSDSGDVSAREAPVPCTES